MTDDLYVDESPTAEVAPTEATDVSPDVAPVDAVQTSTVAIPEVAPAAPLTPAFGDAFNTFLNELEGQMGKMEMATAIFHFSVIKQKIREMIAKARAAL